MSLRSSSTRRPRAGTSDEIKRRPSQQSSTTAAPLEAVPNIRGWGVGESVQLNIYIYTYIHTYIHIYIYIYFQFLCKDMSNNVYIYIYIHIISYNTFKLLAYNSAGLTQAPSLNPKWDLKARNEGFYWMYYQA